MKKYIIKPIGLMLNDNRVHPHGTVVTADQLTRPVDELLAEKYIEEYTEPAKTAAELKAEKKAANEAQAAADAAAKEQADADAKAKEEADAKAKEEADAKELQDAIDAEEALKNAGNGGGPNPEDIIKK
jgi:FKBP-type peptidyl-prolyl cis-trans isomerase